MGRPGWASVAVPAAVAALFLGPLWAVGELGVWSFTQPRSHLQWDEAGERPGSPPSPRAAEEPGGRALLEARVLAGPALLLAGASLAAALRRRR
jgi:hypothetical protein